MKRALDATGPAVYQRSCKESFVDAVEPRMIRELWAAWPTTPATVIAEPIGWERSIRVTKEVEELPARQKR